MKKIILLLLLQFSALTHSQSGTLDKSFTPGIGLDGDIFNSELLGNGKIIIGGHFSHFDGIPRNGIAQLNADGTLDSSFNPGSGFDNYPLVIKAQNDGKILAGGYFFSYNGLGGQGLVRLNPDGTLDKSFISSVGGTVRSIAIQPDGKIIIVGSFTYYRGVPSCLIARLNIDGSIDTSFKSPFTYSTVSDIYSVAIQTDGKILVGGGFNDYNAPGTNNIARLNPNGTLDSGFKIGTGANDRVRDIKIQNDGKILIAGNFTSYNNITGNRIARLNNDGSLDSNFTAGALIDNNVYSCAIHDNGKIVIGGHFSSGINNQLNVIQLNPNGSIDSNFNPGFGTTEDAINSVKIQGDGKILISGAFGYGNSNIKYIARFNGELVTAPAPLASAQTLCKNATVANLVATGENLKWYKTATGGASLELTSALEEGIYYVSQTVNTTESKRTSVYVLLNTTNIPSAPSQTFIDGATVSNLSATGQSIKWYNSTEGSPLPISDLLTSGIYYVSQTINGCESARTPVLITVNAYPQDSLVIEQFQTEDIQLFPNPASDMVRIYLNSTENLDSVTVYDLSGKPVQKFLNITANQSNFSLGSFAKGIYLVEIATQNKIKKTKKLIVN